MPKAKGGGKQKTPGMQSLLIVVDQKHWAYCKDVKGAVSGQPVWVWTPAPEVYRCVFLSKFFNFFRHQ